MHHDLNKNPRHGRADLSGQKAARRLGWFSVALGVLELAAARSLTRALGMRGRERLVQLYGLREMTKGIGILSSKDPTPWMWARVAGDALDLGTLSAHYTAANPKRDNVAMALLNVAGVTVFDLYCIQKLRRESRQNLTELHDYSDRSGFPRSPEEMRGAACDFEVPRDMRTPEALQPYTASPEEMVHH